MNDDLSQFIPVLGEIDSLNSSGFSFHVTLLLISFPGVLQSNFYQNSLFPFRLCIAKVNVMKIPLDASGKLLKKRGFS